MEHRNLICSMTLGPHGGGGPQVGEVPHLPVVKESLPSPAIFTTPGPWGEVSKCFQIVSTRS